ncbi:MAG: alpha/beta hydrolase [Actinomycetota bacterium]
MPTHSINGTDLFVETVGDGPAILLLHGGLGLDHTYFRPAFDRLADRATLVYYDHRGNGRSARPADYPAEVTFENLVADAIGVLDALEIEHAVVLGHSYGGFIAQQLAATHPSRVTKLILANTAPVLDYQPMPSGSERAMAAFGALFSGPVADDAQWRSLWTEAAPLYYHRWDDTEAARIDAATHYVGDAWNVANGLLATFNTLEQLPNITAPTLCVTGRHDFITPAEPGAERMANLIPDAEAAVFEASGHYPFLEESDDFFALLTRFLD